MSYLIFARKYRPQTFEDMVGQRSVVQTLQNAIRTKRVTQAYLFSGMRGHGQDDGRPDPGQGPELRRGADPDALQRL